MDGLGRLQCHAYKENKMYKLKYCLSFTITISEQNLNFLLLLKGMIPGSACHEFKDGLYIWYIDSSGPQFTYVLNMVEKYKPRSYKFINNFNLNDIYSYLDSISLMKEHALLHLMLLSALLLTLFNILAVLFGNEIIKYFNIENKYPFLSNLYIKTYFNSKNLL